MGPRNGHQFCMQPLAPLMEAPDPEDQQQQHEKSKKDRSWEAIRTWIRTRSHLSIPSSKRMDLKLILGVLGCPLAPIPLADGEPSHHFSIKDSPMTCSAGYIIHQYLAATGCLKLEKCKRSMYVAGAVRIICGESENGSGSRRSNRVNGCFVLWQMSPGMWLVELVAAGFKVVAGSNGKVVWRHLPWLGTNAARGPRRPLRRIIQGLDPQSTASMFSRAQCLGEKRIGDDHCFVLKVSADRAAVAERNDGPAEVIRHVLYGYFSQKSGLLVYLEDSHLTRVQTPGSGAVYWETTIGSCIGDYRQVDGILIAHQGRSVASLLRFGHEDSAKQRSGGIRMEEEWRIDDVAFNVQGLSVDCFIPPTDILNVKNGA